MVDYIIYMYYIYIYIEREFIHFNLIHFKVTVLLRDNVFRKHALLPLLPLCVMQRNNNNSKVV